MENQLVDSIPIENFHFSKTNVLYETKFEKLTCLSKNKMVQCH